MTDNKICKANDILINCISLHTNEQLTNQSIRDILSYNIELFNNILRSKELIDDNESIICSDSNATSCSICDLSRSINTIMLRDDIVFAIKHDDRPSGFYIYNSITDTKQSISTSQLLAIANEYYFN